MHLHDLQVSEAYENKYENFSGSSASNRQQISWAGIEQETAAHNQTYRHGCSLDRR